MGDKKMKSLMSCADHNAFTLIELMIVIAILGILAAVAIPNFIQFRNKAYCSMAEADAMHIEGAIVGYFAMSSHTDITTEDVTFNPRYNHFSVSTIDPNLSITIYVTDTSNLCPDEYKKSNPSADDGNGWWDDNVFQKTISLKN